MASHDHEGIPILPPEKKRRLTSFSKCVICQGDKNEVLRKGKESSVETFISALSLRHDEVYERLYSKFPTERILNCFGILLATRPIQASKILDTLQVLTFPHHV